MSAPEDAVRTLLQEAHAAEQAALLQLARRVRRTRDLGRAQRLADQRVDAERRRRELSERLHELGAGPSLRAALAAVVRPAPRGDAPAAAASRALSRLAAAAEAAGDVATKRLAERHRREWDSAA
jgi:hypothetical protein